MQVERLAHPLLAGRRETGERATTVLRTGVAAHQSGGGQAVDRSREPARGERRLGCEVAHPEPPAWRARKPYEDLEFLPSELALALQRRADRPPQAQGRLEDESGQRYPVDFA